MQSPVTLFTRGISIRKQLPLLICLLLLTLITLFGAISYIGIRRASMEAGQERLKSLTGQLSSLFQQSAHAMIASTQDIANREEIRNYLSPDAGPRSYPEEPSIPRPSPARALEVLSKLTTDTTNILVELQDAQGKRLLYAGRDKIA